jgi:phospholipase/carboxylesterase
MQPMRREKFASLESILITVGEDRGDGPVVVLLHGFGAPGEDLVPLAQYFDVPEGTRFLFPAAPHEVEPFGGRAWWMIDVMALQMAIAEGRARDLANDVPEGLAEARAQIDALLDEIPARLGTDRVVLGGFSQGAMLSLEVALRRRQSPRAVALLSGTLLAEREWVPLMPTKKEMPVFQSHGVYDPLLPFPAAEALRDHLTAAGLSVEWVPFRGQHEIPPPVLVKLGQFLRRVL